jgi:hypothetical protein
VSHHNWNEAPQGHQGSSLQAHQKTNPKTHTIKLPDFETNKSAEEKDIISRFVLSKVCGANNEQAHVPKATSLGDFL